MSEIEPKIKFSKEINQLINNLDKIPDEFFVNTDGRKYRVLWLMDRQKPSVEVNYDFDEERFGITRNKEIIWGFDSGCSCPSPWSQGDYGDESYQVEKTWKEFNINYGDKKESKEEYSDWFDVGWKDECYSNLKDYLLITQEQINPLEVLKIKNAEVRRYLMKRVGYENIQNHSQVSSIHKEGDSELLSINGDK